MLMNVNGFKDLLKKSTLNLSINSVQFKFGDDKISSKMISTERDAIAILNVQNECIEGIGEEVEFNFSEPSQQLIPFLNLIDEEEADVDIKDEKIVIRSGRQKSNVHFCSPQVVSIFTGDSVREGVDFFHELKINDEFVESFTKIKKIGSRFGKVYFNVSNKVFSIETSDKTNRFSNGLKFDLENIEGVDDLTICFDFKNFVNLMTVINGNADTFTMKFAYVEDQEMGMLFAISDDESEKYYLMSREGL